MLQEKFIHLLAKFTNDSDLINKYWTEIKKNYAAKARHYHTLAHLDNLLHQLMSVKSNISNWESVLFALYYHDIIYNPLKSNNEEQSALLAEKRMIKAGVPIIIIEQCKAHILATKQHLSNPQSDTNLFTDADLSILGLDWETYSSYYKNVRKEYSVYPDLIYIPGRKKVLNHFLKMDRIFKSDYFYAEFEHQAKLNLQQELQSL